MSFISVQSSAPQLSQPASCLPNCGPQRLFPFPYGKYYIGSLTVSYGILDAPYPAQYHYYSDPTLDAVQLNVELKGDPASWGSTTHDVYCSYGLLKTPSPTGINVAGGVITLNEADPIVDPWRYSSSFNIPSPLSNKYVAADQTQTSPGPQVANLRKYHGVASNDSWTQDAYIQAPCYGRPIGFEMWYSENETQTNNDVKFVGYTSVGDMTGGDAPSNFSLPPGHMRRYTCGYFRTGTDLTTLYPTGSQVGGVRYPSNAKDAIFAVWFCPVYSIQLSVINGGSGYTSGAIWSVTGGVELPSSSEADLYGHYTYLTVDGNGTITGFNSPTSSSRYLVPPPSQTTIIPNPAYNVSAAGSGAIVGVTPTVTGGKLYLLINGAVYATKTVAFPVHRAEGWFETAYHQVISELEQKPQSFYEIGIDAFNEDGSLSDFVYFDRTINPSIPLDLFDVKWAWHYDFLPDAGEGTYCGLVMAAAPMMYTHPGFPCADCPDPVPMIPFPYETYFFEIDPGWDSNVYDPISGYYYPLSYYNDETLDAVQYNVRFGGDETAWLDTTHEVWYGPGLPPAQYYAAGTPLMAADLNTTLGTIGTASSPWCWVDWPLSDKYYSAEGGIMGPKEPGLRTYPGVATTDTLYRGSGWTEVPCYGRPVWFEAWFDHNPLKSNNNVTFSGYTTYADFSNTNDIGPRVNDFLTEGYVKKSAMGVLYKDADVTNLRPSDIVWGIYFEGTPTGGVASFCLNGVVDTSLTINFKPNITWPYINGIMYGQPYADLNGKSQGWSWIQFYISDYLSNNDDLLEVYFDNTKAFDTFNTKWGWYHHFIPDTGVGTYGGQITAGMPSVLTHPGLPCTPTPEHYCDSFAGYSWEMWQGAETPEKKQRFVPIVNPGDVACAGDVMVTVWQSSDYCFGDCIESTIGNDLPPGWNWIIQDTSPFWAQFQVYYKVLTQEDIDAGQIEFTERALIADTCWRYTTSWMDPTDPIATYIRYSDNGQSSIPIINPNRRSLALYDGLSVGIYPETNAVDSYAWKPYPAGLNGYEFGVFSPDESYPTLSALYGFTGAYETKQPINLQLGGYKPRPGYIKTDGVNNVIGEPYTSHGWTATNMTVTSPALSATIGAGYSGTHFVSMKLVEASSGSSLSRYISKTMYMEAGKTYTITIPFGADLGGAWGSSYNRSHYLRIVDVTTGHAFTAAKTTSSQLGTGTSPSFYPTGAGNYWYTSGSQINLMRTGTAGGTDYRYHNAFVANVVPVVSGNVQIILGTFTTGSIPTSTLSYTPAGTGSTTLLVGNISILENVNLKYMDHRLMQLNVDQRPLQNHILPLRSGGQMVAIEFKEKDYVYPLTPVSGGQMFPNFGAEIIWPKEEIGVIETSGLDVLQLPTQMNFGNILNPNREQKRLYFEIRFKFCNVTNPALTIGLTDLSRYGTGTSDYANDVSTTITQTGAAGTVPTDVWGIGLDFSNGLGIRRTVFKNGVVQSSTYSGGYMNSTDYAHLLTFTNSGTTYNFHPLKIRTMAPFEYPPPNGFVGLTDIGTSIVDQPSAPINITATKTGVSTPWNAIKVDWTNTASTEYGAYVQYSTNGIDWTSAAIATIGAVTYTVTGLTPLTTYTFRVAPYNEGGVNETATPTAAITTDAVPVTPADPTNFTATVLYSTAIQFDWADMDSNETGFRLDRSTNGSTWTTIAASIAANTITYNWLSATANTATYYFRIRSFNQVYVSNWVQIGPMSTPPIVVPLDPSGLTSSSVGVTNVTLTWTDNSYNSPTTNNETGFYIERSPGGAGTWTQIGSVGQGVVTYLATGLTGSTNYDFRVRAYNTAGNSGYSNTYNVTTNAPPTTATETISFTNKTFLTMVYDLVRNVGYFPAGSYLWEVTINATLTVTNATSTYANDLTFYIGPPAPTLAGGGLLMIGGTTSIAAQRLFWTGGASATAGTTVTGTLTQDNFGAAIDLNTHSVYYGNGYNTAGGTGTWTGTITYKYIVP